jgi:metal-responsive CopG/Arc/MetJ family transcriptional regulator
MAKVMISIPDELLARVDARAKSVGESRSGFLQRLAEHELRDEERLRRNEVQRLMRNVEATFGENETPFDVVELIREDREAR